MAARDYGEEVYEVPDVFTPRNPPTIANIAIQRTTSTDGVNNHAMRLLPDNTPHTDRSSPSNGDENGGATYNYGPRKYRQRTNKLKRKLKDKHVNMIAFSSVVGVGLYLQNGRIIYLAGPGVAFLIYPVMIAIIWGAMGSLGEMTALYPVPGAMFELPARFLDQSIGYAIGWMAWFTWVVVFAAELDSIATLFKFQFEKSYLREVNYPQDHLGWSTYRINSAIWVTVFWMFSFGLNMLPIRAYGEIEYWIGVIKMFCIVGLIMFQLVINVQTGTGDRYYRDPYSFITQSFETAKDGLYYGAKAQLAGVWSALVVAIYSLVGFESVSVTAAENEEFDPIRRSFANKESIMIATRKISIRIMMLYSISTFLVSLNVPADDSSIKNVQILALGGGQHSAFIIAAVRAGITFWPGFINGLFLLSATSASINSLYLSSRLLHALALSKPAWPDHRCATLCREWLEQVTGSGWREGVPQNSILVSSAFGLLGYLSVSKGPEQELGRLAINSSVSSLIVYTVICFTYLRFKSLLQRAVGGSFPQDANYDEVISVAFDRNSEETYPYRSSGQPLRAFVAGVACSIIVIFNGWRSISPFRAADFFASYISVVIFLLIWLSYRIRFLGRELFQQI